MKRLALCLVLVALASCKTKPAAPDGDAGSKGSTAADAGSAVVDAGSASGGGGVDAGSASTASTASTAGAIDAGTGSASAANSGGTTARPPEAGNDAAGGPASAFDRILIKPKDPNADPEAVRALVEKKLGVKTTAARRTALHWVLVTLAPANRTFADQKAVIEQLKSVDAFVAVEGDRVMKVR